MVQGKKFFVLHLQPFCRFKMCVYIYRFRLSQISISIYLWREIKQIRNSTVFQRTAEKGRIFFSGKQIFLKHPDNAKFESVASNSQFLCCSSLRMVLEQLSPVRAVASSPFLLLLGLELLRSLMMLIYLQIHLDKFPIFLLPFLANSSKDSLVFNVSNFSPLILSLAFVIASLHDGPQ